MALCEGHKKGSYIGKVITWSIFYLSCPLEAVCMCSLSSFQLVLYFMCSDSLCILFVTQNPTTNMLLAYLVFGIWYLAREVNYLPVFV